MHGPTFFNAPLLITCLSAIAIETFICNIEVEFNRDYFLRFRQMPRNMQNKTYRVVGEYGPRYVTM